MNQNSNQVYQGNVMKLGFSKYIFLSFTLCGLLGFLGISTSNVLAQQDTAITSKEERNLTIIAVGEAGVEKEKIIILPPYIEGKLSLQESSLVEEFSNLLSNDFIFYRRLFFVPNYRNFDKGIIPSNPISSNWPDYGYWASKQANYLVSMVAASKNSLLEIEVAAHDIRSKKERFRTKVLLEQKSLRERGHQVANEIYKVMTGKESIFNSKIVFVCDLGTISQKEPIKELFMSDFDGGGLRKLTNHKSTIISPAISDDKRFIVYSLITQKAQKKNIDLYMLDLEKNTSVPVSTRSGINSGAVFLPDGEHIALTLTLYRSADIFTLNLKTHQLRRLTNHPSEDVDPSFSSDGSTMAFLSGRPGKAMIYTMDPSGEEKSVKRITYVGKFNTSPRFSNSGKEIAFASWTDNSFDIYRINTQGNELVRLTKDFGSNEDPSFSNDDQFIVFSSTRNLSTTSSQKNVYIMDRDGDILGPITKNLGNCLSPRWSK